MKNSRSILLHMLLLVIVAMELAGRITGRPALEYFSKPLIMIWMGTFFLLYRRGRAHTIPVMIAFFFSWTGDILLMGSSASELYFFAGVGGFFLAQLAYIYTFLSFSEQGVRGYLQRNPVTGFLFLGYAAGIYWLLWPGLEGLLKPVILVYALSLIGMSMAALNRHTRVGYRSYLLVFTGSLFFVVSDSMIAISRFLVEFPLDGFWIMVSYITAQYLIMRGLVLQTDGGLRT